MIRLLDTKRIPGSEFDSSARYPPPKCHRDTRRSLRNRIMSWLSNPHRNCRMVWVLGPPGVGKSAVAQTVAEGCNEARRLGTAFFFSRLNQRDDPYRVIPTIAYQLACRDAHYKSIINQQFAEDSRILEKDLNTQFRELITRPLQYLATTQPFRLLQPLLIILDGLDECYDEEAQCEFIQLIGDNACSAKNFPILWMVCSRPEWHLKSLLSDPDFPITCIREELSVDDSKAQDEVYHFLCDGFEAIRRKYRDRLACTWPPLKYLQELADTASGHFGLASAILNFVGDKNRRNPEGQLQACIEFLRDPAGAPGSTNPFQALDRLYHRVFSDVPIDVLPIAMRILGFSIFIHSHRFSALTQANFLRLDRGSFYRSLDRLHSVLHIPESSNANVEPVRFYHASLGDFLKDSRRSTDFFLDEATVKRDLKPYAHHWFYHTLPRSKLSPTPVASPSF